jgi:hypothetical protein
MIASRRQLQDMSRLTSIVLVILACAAVLAACGDDDDDYGGGDLASCVCDVGGFDPETGEGIVSYFGVDTLTIDEGVVPVTSRPILRGSLIIDPAAGVIHVRDFSEANILDLGVPLKDAVPWHETGLVSEQPIYVVLAEAPLIHGLRRNSPTTPFAIADLSAFDDDGDPDITRIATLDAGLLVVMSRIDDANGSQRPAIVALLDYQTLEVITSFEAIGGAPQDLYAEPGEPYTLLATRDGSVDGCLQRIDIDGTSASSVCLAQNDELGGYVATLERDWAVIVSDDDERRLVPLDIVGDTATTGAPINPPEHRPTAVQDCLESVIYVDASTGRLHVHALQPGVSTTSTDGVSIGLPALDRDAFACTVLL